MAIDPVNNDFLRSYERELVGRAQQGDDEAFLELMGRTKRSSVRLARSILQDHSAAEDEVQNAYLKVWAHLGQFRSGARFATWVWKIVANQCLMRLRQLRQARMISLDDVKNSGGYTFEAVDPGETAEEILRRRQMAAGLRTQIGRLPPLLQKALLLHDLEGLPVAEVASQLGISKSAAKSRVCRARMELKSRMAFLLEAGRSPWAAMR